MKLYHFIQTPIFASCIDATKEDGLLEAVEAEIAERPLGKAHIGGGIRKTRVASTKRTEGKSGGYRIWYLHFVPDDFYLLFLLDKHDAPDLTKEQEKVLAAEARRSFRDKGVKR